MKTAKRQTVWLLAMVVTGNFGVFHLSVAAAHPAGTNISSNGTIYMVTDDGYIRPYTSAGAFLSYSFNVWPTVQPASPEDLALPKGSFIPARDGKIVCSDRGADKGTCYLITNGKTAAFVSEAVFKGLGFSFAKALYGDVSFLEKDSNIESPTEQHRLGVIIKQNGGMYLVGSTGLLSVPSLDVLKTWGYSGDDVVPANIADASLSQTSILPNRVGAQLSPNGGGPSASAAAPTVDEDSLVQSYLDTYPDLPVATISAPEDGAMVIDLVKKINDIPGSTVAAVYPYLTSDSINLFNKSPKFKAYWDSPSIHLINLNQVDSKVQVFEGGVTALYVVNDRQNATAYPYTEYWVCKKENGLWKWDILGTIKYQDKISKQNNPDGVAIIGTGKNDLAVSTAVYTSPPLINDPHTWMLFRVKNQGQTTVKKFHVLIHFNQVIVDDDVVSYELKPTDWVDLAAPIIHYWQIAGVRSTPGSYPSDVTVDLGQFNPDAFVADNTKTITTEFQQAIATSSIGTIVGGQ